MKNMNTYIKMILMIVITFTFCACNNVTEPSVSDVLIQNDGQTGELSLSIRENVSRSAVPTIAADQFQTLILTSNDNNLDYIGIWNSYEEMQQAKISVQTGTWKFKLVGICGSAMYNANTQVTIVSGVNHIEFEMIPALMTSSDYGYGSLEIKMVYPPTNVAAVTAGLYNTDEKVIVGYADDTLIQKSGGNTEYIKDDIPSGNYVVIFKFYADADKTLLLGTYREYASIVNEMNSVSRCTLESLSKLYSINFQLGGGSFINAYTAPGTYTRQSADIDLPAAVNVTRTGYVFDGWFTNAQYTDEAESAIPTGSTGNKTFYAKWKKELSLTLMPNGGTFAVGSPYISQTVFEDETADIRSSADLGLTNGKHRFLGWSESANGGKKYDDGGWIKTSTAKTLYAVWSASDINPDDTNKDTDGDGLTDYEELHTCFTDPTNADTDGDGWTDYEEVHGLYNPTSNVFNPRIADVPDLKIIITSKPSISYKYTMTSGSTETTTQTLTEGTVASQGGSKTNSKTSSTGSTWSLSNAFSLKHSFSPIGNPNVMSWEWQDTVTVGKTWSFNNSDTYTYSSNESQSFSKNISNGHSTSETSSKTWTGGTFKIMVKFQNPSSIAYHVDSLDIAITRIPNNAGEASIPVATITKTSIGTIAPGAETGEFVLTADLSVSGTEDLLKWSSGVNVSISGYAISIQKSMESMARNDFTGALTRVWNKSANVSIDYGPASNLNPETYFVSTKYKFNPDATTAEGLYDKPNLLEIMEDVLHLTQDSGKLVLMDDGRIKSIRNIENKNNPDMTVTDVEEGGWYIMHTYTNSVMKTVSDLYNMSYNTTGTIMGLADIVVSPKDNIHIFYNVDKDGDGVPACIEVQHGTSDDNEDTDGDGLTDFEEIFGWHGKGALDSKYTGDNKCYSNPINTDTDGDDFFDYIKNYESASEDQKATVDNDPIIPKMKNIAEIKSAKYAVSATGTFKDLPFSGTSATLNNLNEYIFLDIEPKLSFSQVHYRRSETEEYKPLDKTTEIRLNIGANPIYIRVTAPDETTQKVWTVNANSVFRTLTGGKITSPALSGGKVHLSWNAYSDERANNDTYNGYVLYGHIGNNDMYGSGKPTRIQVNDAASFSNNSTYKDGNFILKMTKEDMLKGSATVNVKPNTHYDFGLFAYVGCNNDSNYKIATLYASNLDTAKEEYGTLTFYAYYIKNYNNHDGGYDPEYYWYCYSDIFDKFSDLNVTTSTNKKWDDDDGNRRYWCFAHNDLEDYAPSRTDSNHIKTFTQKFKRGQDHTGYVRFDIYEEDHSSSDDHIGDQYIKFVYNSTSDLWTVKWTDAGNKSGGSKGDHSWPVSMTDDIKRDYTRTWDSDGEVEVYFGVKWE